MKNFLKKLFSKRLFAGVMAIVFVALVLSGCKIEFPDEVGSTSSSNVSEVTSQAQENQSEQSSENVSEQSSNTDDKNQNPTNANSDKKQPAGNSSSNSSSSANKPKPVEPEDAQVNENKQLTCTLSITCKNILNNMDLFNKDKLTVLPKDGVIYAERTVTFKEGESVFDVLVRETQAHRIQMEHESFPIYNSEYIEGINNIYEFDCGEGSGWMYKVNGWTPNYGCSRYQIKPGDKIEWIYTCDLGQDVAGSQMGSWK